jgi:cytochrome c
MQVELTGFRMSVAKYSYVCAVVMVAILSGCGGTGDEPATAASQASASIPSMEAMLAAADIKRGQTLFFQCRACHSLEEGGINKVGPNLYGVFGRKAGLAEGFLFSEVLTNAEVIWTDEAMDKWLARPSEFLPGNQMIFVGVKDAQDRANLIAFLQQETGAK